MNEQGAFGITCAGCDDPLHGIAHLLPNGLPIHPACRRAYFKGQIDLMEKRREQDSNKG